MPVSLFLTLNKNCFPVIIWQSLNQILIDFDKK